MLAHTPTDWYSDAPVAQSSEDSLDRSTFLDRMEAVLQQLHGTGESSVLALIGAWGSGKSSLLEQLAERLVERPETEQQWVTVQFNPWYYQDLVSLQSGFFRELHAALPAGVTWKKAQDAIAGLARSVAPLGSLLSLLGVDASRAIAGVADMMRSDDGVVVQHNAAEAALKKAATPVLIVVDDVDRLDPPELLLLFKLIRLVGRLPNVHYLLAYDERTLLEALGRTGLVGNDDRRRSIDYLEKIVQVRLDVPPVRQEQLTEWVNASLVQLSVTHGIELTEEFTARFSRAYFGHLQQRLTTPRSVKRYFAQVDAFLGGVVGEVDFIDFLIVSWLRAAEPLLYRAIVAHRGVLLGEASTGGPALLAGERDAAANRSYWEQVFQDARVSPEHVDGVALLLGQLFPRFHQHWTQRQGGYGGGADPERVAHADYFDRFFAFAVPEEDLSDRLVRSAFEQVIGHSPGPDLHTVESVLPDRAQLVLAKFDAWASPGAAGNAELVIWLTRNFHQLPQHHSLADAQQRAKWLGCRLYVTLDASDQERVLEEAQLTVAGLRFFSFLSFEHDREGHGPDADQSGPAAPHPVSVTFAHRIAERFAALGAVSSPLEIDDELWLLFWDWKRIDLPAARTWVDEGFHHLGWPLVDFAGRCFSTTIPLHVKNPKPQIGDFDADSFAELVDLDAHEPPTQLPQVSSSPRHRLPSTPDNRRSAAARTLSALFAERAHLSEPESRP